MLSVGSLLVVVVAVTVEVMAVDVVGVAVVETPDCRT